MDVSPQEISTQTFSIVKKGYDPAAVRAYLSGVSKALEASQQQATAMEARARAAVAKLQELSQSGEHAPAGASAEEAETISRTLLLAQKTADGLISEARAEADTMISAARAEATGLLGEAQQQAEAAVEEGRADGRKVFESERNRAESEVQALLARRDFLLGDVEQLESFVEAHRQRLQEIAATLQEAAGTGLGDLRRPLLSAAADAPAPGGDSATSGADAQVGDETPDHDPRAEDASDAAPTAEISSLAALVDADAEAPGDAEDTEDAEPTPPGNPRLLDFGA
jgi:DivIVA domain-containing protein